jgi:hypothetical protein
MLRGPLMRGAGWTGCGADRCTGAGMGVAYPPGELSVCGAGCTLCCALGPRKDCGALACTELGGIGDGPPGIGVCGITGAGVARSCCACGCASLAPVEIFCRRDALLAGREPGSTAAAEPGVRLVLGAAARATHPAN